MLGFDSTYDCNIFSLQVIRIFEKYNFYFFTLICNFGCINIYWCMVDPGTVLINKRDVSNRSNFPINRLFSRGENTVPMCSKLLAVITGSILGIIFMLAGAYLAIYYINTHYLIVAGL